MEKIFPLINLEELPPIRYVVINKNYASVVINKVRSGRILLHIT